MLKNTREMEKVEGKGGKIRRGEGSEGERRRGDGIEERGEEEGERTEERMGGGRKGLNNLIWLKHCI